MEFLWEICPRAWNVTPPDGAREAGLRCIGITTTYPAAQLTLADRVIDSLSSFTPAFVRSLEP